METADVLLIGDSLSGYWAAKKLAKAGLQVTLLLPKAYDNMPKESGVNFSQIRPDVNADELSALLNRTSDFTANPMSVDLFVEKSKDLLSHLVQQELLLSDDLAHTYSEEFTWLESVNLTHTEVKEGLKEEIESNDAINILRLPIIDLITLSKDSSKAADRYKKDACLGVYVLDEKNRRICPIVAKETIICDNGLHQHFVRKKQLLETSNLSLALRAGVRSCDIEKIVYQFFVKVPEQGLVEFPYQFMNPSLKVVNSRDELLLDLSACKDITHFVQKFRQLLYEDLEELFFSIKLSTDELESMQRVHWDLFNKLGSFQIDGQHWHLPVVCLPSRSLGGCVIDKKGNTTLNRLRAIGNAAASGALGQLFHPKLSLMELLIWTEMVVDDIIHQLSRFAYYQPTIKQCSLIKFIQCHHSAYGLFKTLRYGFFEYLRSYGHKSSLNILQALIKTTSTYVEEQFREHTITKEVLILRDLISFVQYFVKTDSPTQDITYMYDYKHSLDTQLCL